MVLSWRTGPPDSTEAQRRIVVCNAEDLPKWEGIGKEIWPNVFPFPGEVVHWTEYSLPHNEFPTVDEVKAADLLIMGGSHYSAYEDLAWIHRYAQLIPQYVATGTRMLACCFGHQILAKAMGGEVGKNPDGRFVLGVEEVYMDQARLGAKGLLQPLKAALQPAGCPEPSVADPGPPPLPLEPVPEAVTPRPPSSSSREVAVPTMLQESSSNSSTPHTEGGGAGGGRGKEGDCLCVRMVVSHGDCVRAMPPGAQLLAWSDSTEVEMFCMGSNVLSFQYHPEMHPDLAFTRILPTMSSSGRLSTEEAAEAAHRLQHVPPDAQAMAAALLHFVNHGLTHEAPAA
ncbi:class I glutamine amidotransferase-like protein [Haematococcus lacustris]